MTLTTFLTQRQIMRKNMPKEALEGPFAQQQKILLYVLPLVFAISGVYFPLGVVLYWLTLEPVDDGSAVLRDPPDAGARNAGRGGAPPSVGSQGEAAWGDGPSWIGGGGGGGTTGSGAPTAQTKYPRSTKEHRATKQEEEVGRLTMTEPWPPEEFDRSVARPAMADRAAEPSAQQPSQEMSEQDRLRALEHEGDIAADYLEGLLDIADFDGDIDMDVEGDRAMVSVVGADLDELVGADGQVLEALQELTRLAVVRETGQRSRLMLDVSGFRARKRAELTKLAEETVQQARTTGEAIPLIPMTPFERKVVHDAVAAAGLRSESEGEEPERFVVVRPN